MGKNEGVRNGQEKDRKAPAKTDFDGNVVWVGDEESPVQTLQRRRDRGAETGTPSGRRETDSGGTRTNKQPKSQPEDGTGAVKVGEGATMLRKEG